MKSQLDLSGPPHLRVPLYKDADPEGKSRLVLVVFSALFALSMLVLLWIVWNRPRAVIRIAAPAHQPTPVGKFSGIRTLQLVGAKDEWLRDHLAEQTCFAISDTTPSGQLKVDILLMPPPGRYTYTMADVIEVYQFQLSDVKGRIVWSGKESTRQKVVPAEGVHFAPGMSFYKDITGEQAEELLLFRLKAQACGM